MAEMSGVASSRGAVQASVMGRSRRPPAPPLPEDPASDFFVRYKLRWAHLSRSLDRLALVVVLVSAVRHWQVPSPPLQRAELFFLWGYTSLWALCIICPLPAYLRTMELTAALMRLLLYGLGPGWELQRRQLNQPHANEPPPAAGGGLLQQLARCACHAVLLLFVSGAVPMAHLTLFRPVRLSFSIATQLVLVGHSAGWARSQCGTAQLSAPAAQRLTHQIFSALALLGHLTPVPAYQQLLDLSPPDGASECTALLRFCQLVVGLLVPLAWQAAAESALFSAHQRQRAAAGLPPQWGPSRRLYSAVRGLLHPMARPKLAVCGVLAVALAWQVAVRSSWR